MILVTGTIDCDPLTQDDLMKALGTLAQHSRNEDGCDWYSLGIDLDDPHRFHVHERWASDEALKAHMESPEFTGFMAAARSFGIRRADLQRHEVTGTRPVFG